MIDSRGVQLTTEPTPEPTAMSLAQEDALAKPSGSIGTPVIVSNLSHKDFTNRQGMVMKYIAAGTFTMGSPFNEPGRLFHEIQHPVIISKPFYLQATEVTQSQWKSIMGYNPSFFKGENLPVEKVSWNEVQAFIQKLNNQGEGTYRLPTESEWEFAARAGTSTPYALGQGTELTLTQANFADEATAESGQSNGSSGQTDISRGQTTVVAKFAPNAWGLYDMHGNVVEWVQDLYGPYPLGITTDPTGATTGLNRVCRGGGWDLKALFARSADRNFNPPHHISAGIGFRVAKSFL